MRCSPSVRTWAARLAGSRCAACAGGAASRRSCASARARCSGFVLYATPSVLDSQTSSRSNYPRWRPSALRRGFFAGAVFRDLDVRAGAKELHAKSGVDVGSALGSVANGKTPLTPQLAHAAAQILREYLYARWRGGPAIARLETRNEIPNGDPGPAAPSVEPAARTRRRGVKSSCWNGELLPALADLRRELEWREGAEPACERAWSSAATSTSPPRSRSGTSSARPPVALEIESNGTSGRRAATARRERLDDHYDPPPTSAPTT